MISEEREIMEYEAYEKKELNAPRLFGGSEIFRFEMYELLKSESGEYFIVPAKNAQLQEVTLSAFDYYPDILFDFISLAQKISLVNGKQGGSKEAAIELLRFCNRYGLFNISGYFIEGIYEDEEGVKRVDLNNEGFKAINQSAMELTDYAKMFFPTNWERYQELINDEALHSYLFNNYFCESVALAEIVITNLLEKFNLWFEFQSGGYNPYDQLTLRKKDAPPDFPDELREKILLYWKNYLGGFLAVHDIGVSVDYDGSWHLKFLCSNLIQPLRIMFLKNIIEENQSIRLCEKCKTAYLARTSSQKCCSPSCSNALRQKRFQEKKRKGNK